MNETLPKGIPFIIINEAAERFSYYGMRAILVVFMSSMLLDRSGDPAPMPEAEAVTWYHVFGTANYLFPLAGALLADVLWGKYRTIIALSLVYCLGHLVLAVELTRSGLALGLLLIALGAGGIKPCVSAHMGDQFSEKSSRWLSQTFAAFYLAINVGAFTSTIVTPHLLERYGAHVAFAVPGIFMLLATIVFWCGRNRFIAIPPAGWGPFRSELQSGIGREAFIKLGVLFTFVAVFWALFDQIGSTWVVQAQRMDRTFELELGGAGGSSIRFEILPAQVQALNPILILLLVPVFLKWIYPFFERSFPVGPIGRIVLGMSIAALSFLIIAAAEYRLESGEKVSILWQCLAYLPLTIGEVLVSITTLEYAYTQAPHRLKSVMTSFYLLSMSLGNAFTAAMSFLLTKPDGTLALPASTYFLLYAVLVLMAAFLVRICCKSSREQLFLQNAQAAN